MPGLAEDPVPCTFEDLHFILDGGLTIIPLKMEIEEDQNKDDYAKVTMTNIAAEAVQDNYSPKDPVTIEYNGETITRLFIPKGGVSVGEDTGTVELYDPLILLEEGSVEGEYNKGQLNELVNMVYDENVEDPNDVLTGVRFNVDGEQVEYQHDLGNFKQSSMGVDVADTLLELSPFHDGDGWFDFRDDSPRTALVEICKAFGTDMYVNAEGELVIGYPDAEPNAYATGVERGYEWNLLSYDMPDYEQTIGKVVVRGSTRATETQTETDMSASAATDALAYNDTLEKATPFASASFAGHSGRVKKVQYGQSSSLATLESVAVNTLIQQFRDARSGSITVSPVADQSAAEIAELKVGDIINVAQYEDCIPGGTFRIVGIHHRMSTRGKWEIDLNVINILPAEINTDTWEYTPLDDSESENAITLENALGGIAAMGESIGMALNAFGWANVDGQDGQAEISRNYSGAGWLYDTPDTGGTSGSDTPTSGSGTGEDTDPSLDDILGMDSDQYMETIREDVEQTGENIEDAVEDGVDEAGDILDGL